MATTRRSAASARSRSRRALRPSVLFMLFASSAGTLLGFPAVAEADAPPAVTADTDPSGAHVELDRDLSWVESGSSGAGGGAHVGCRRRWVPAPGPYLPQPSSPQAGQQPALLPTPPTPGALPYFVYCGNAYVALIWAVPAQFNGGNVAGALRSLAERLVRDLPFPRAGVEVSPGERGLTGLESWFWVSGYDGTPLVDTVSGFGTSVTVEARATRATWSFGDGTEVVAGLGRPYPERSDVTHVYERRSGRDGYAVGVAFEFEARYRVDGGDWQALAPVTRDVQRAYVVDEVRAQLIQSG